MRVSRGCPGRCLLLGGAQDLRLLLLLLGMGATFLLGDVYRLGLVAQVWESVMGRVSKAHLHTFTGRGEQAVENLEKKSKRKRGREECGYKIRFEDQHMMRRYRQEKQGSSKSD